MARFIGGHNLKIRVVVDDVRKAVHGPTSCSGGVKEQVNECVNT